MDAKTLRAAFACFPSGVTALSALVNGEPVGMAVSAFTSISLEPPLIAAAIQRTSRTWSVLRQAPALGVSVLAENLGELSHQLAGSTNRFAGVDWNATERGAIFIDGATARFDCEPYQQIPAGDHVIALLKVMSVDLRPAIRPLVFHGSTFRQLA